jgi:hypothetical protein
MRSQHQIYEQNKREREAEKIKSKDSNDNPLADLLKDSFVSDKDCEEFDTDK